MRPCPFCGAENKRASSVCVSCVRRLPPLTSRRRKVQEAGESADTAVAAEGLSVAQENQAPSPDEDWPTPSPPPIAVAQSDDWTLDPAPQGHAEPASEAVDEPAAQPTALLSPKPKPKPELDQKLNPERLTKPPSPSPEPPVQQRPGVSTVALTAPDLSPVPVVPGAGLVSAVKYTLAFASARWQRRGAIAKLRTQIHKDSTILEGIFGDLGRQARSMGLEDKAFKTENISIGSAEARRLTTEQLCTQLGEREAEENRTFGASEAEREATVGASNTALQTAQGKHKGLDAQRKELRDQGKSIDSRQAAYLKTAESRDTEAAKQESEDSRQQLQAAAKVLRHDAQLLAQERQAVDAKSVQVEDSLQTMAARIEALKKDREAAKQALRELRDGHRRRLAEIQAEQGSRTRELAQVATEIDRRLVALGALVHLQRIDNSSFLTLYEEVDTVKGAIAARSGQIDKLSAERQAFDRTSLIRGCWVLGGALAVIISLVALFFAMG